MTASAAVTSRTETLPPAIRAQEIDHRVRQLEKANKQNFVELGQLMVEMEKFAGWRELGYESYDAWISNAAPVSRSSGYEAKRAIEKLSGSVPLSELQDVPRSNLSLLAAIPERERKQWVKSAKELNEPSFRRKIRAEKPELHIEMIRGVRFRLEESQRCLLDLTLEIVGWITAEESREARLEFICAEFGNSPCQVEGYTGMSNAEAYEKARRGR